jgi:deoxyribodipyrimidine photo-lyase
MPTGENRSRMKTLEAFVSDPRLTVRRAGTPDPDGSCVVYWMQRAQRALDNPALTSAIHSANCLGKPVVVYFQLLPRAHHANLRHYQFLVEGLSDIAAELQRRKIGLVVRRYPNHGLLRFCAEVRPCLIISDENPLMEAERAKTRLAAKIGLPFWTVDADVIVPAKLLGKEHYAARTIRPKIHALLPQYLQKVENPPVRFPWRAPSQVLSLAPTLTLLDQFPVDRAVAPSAYFHGGSGAAQRALERFLRHRLKGYVTRRNKPDIDGTSQLSPYLHFGHIGVHKVAMAVNKADAPAEDRQAFLEELIVRRELAVNFVRFNRDYESFDACEPWADVTHRKHAQDQRQFLYSEKQLENAETHDPLWNAAQKQMVLTGWMHGYLRMYWAKKILEWTESPQAAYQIAVGLNDRYELDGRDPNGYAGIAWAIVGKHDRAWGPERPVYGKIRYMSYASTSRKFDSKSYIARVSALEKRAASEL